VQERKEDDPDFGVVLARALNKGETNRDSRNLCGKDVVMDEGGANYYPVARESWLSQCIQRAGNYATYRMVFHVPKGLELIATGTRVASTDEGKLTTTEWKTDVPVAVVGFNLGRFTMKEATIPGKLGDNLTVDAYANTTPPDNFQSMQGGVLGTLDTRSMLPVQTEPGRSCGAPVHRLFRRLALCPRGAHTAVRL